MPAPRERGSLCCSAASHKGSDRMMMRLFRALMVLIVLACFAPFLGVVATAVVSDLYGCAVGQSVQPCVIGGHDYGREVHIIGTHGWLLMLTFPAALATLALWLTVETRRWFKQRQRHEG